MLGHGANKLSPQKIKMAMAITGKNRHYRWNEIRPTHFIEMAAQCGLTENCAFIIKQIVTATPEIIRHIASTLPSTFPQHVSQPILHGLADAAKKLAITPNTIT
jgi:serine/threonine-protein kinase HipA